MKALQIIPKHLFIEYYYGKEAATAYISGIRKNIANDIPIIGGLQCKTRKAVVICTPREPI
jgi:hypothetical protein